MGKSFSNLMVVFLIIFSLNKIVLKGNEIKNIELNTPIILKINKQKILIDTFSLNKVYNINELNSEVPIEFEIEYVPEEIEIKILGNILKDKAKIKIKKIAREIKIPIEILNKRNNLKSICHINTLHEKFPKYTVTGESQYPGDYYGDFISDNNNIGKKDSMFIYKMNSKGEILYYKKHTSTISDFKKTKLKNNQIRYSYFLQDENAYSYEGVGYGPTKLIIMDENYDIIDEITSKQFKEIPENFPLESHDSLIIDDDHYITAAYFGKIVNNVDKDLIENHNGSRVIASILQEVKDGKVIWQWDSTEHPELYKLSVEGNDFKNSTSKWADYIHFNSVTIDPKDGNLICSFRNIDSILKIERGTGKILWILGGKGDQFGLTEEQKFSRQHYARVIKDGSITLFDNGNLKEKSRVLEIKIDEKNKKVLNYKDFYLNDYFSPACGSTDKLDDKKDVFIIGWGMGDFSKRENMTEIDFSTNKKTFELIFHGNMTTYRITKIK
ncbi:aryl-sulfate sulfotransferase [Fusobacterium sp.]|uniref:aryl-sulfate sulfotransferase n=1 Tax=Fusobacterium sp. TaxID=68766 RepID=UPI00290348E0|nr:aryl-sulfate sulfotransferase [Fusobacterium sp.]MDU1912059.1 aryl-sulfate sulfotransferase [Fusobacterium sp.]